ncbi:MAG: hypothetical protein ACREM3_24060 [Candidatus Rokuibacteriota bacterium]
MNTVVGVFGERTAAARAADLLFAQGVPRERVTLLTPGDAGRAVQSVPTTEAEPPGIGRALGGVVGGAAGAATGIQAGALTSLFVPGVGPVLALGILGALVLGVAGAAAGDALDNRLREGLPKDEVFVYEDALRRGRSVVVAIVEDAEAAEAARRVLADAGAESLDAAREQWWVGLREHETAAYAGAGRDFARDETEFRRGFEAALSFGREAPRYGEAAPELTARYPDLRDDDAFRRGYERGREWILAHRRDRAA